MNNFSKTVVLETGVLVDLLHVSNDKISVMPQSNRVPASATAVHSVHPLTEKKLVCWDDDGAAFSCMTCASSFRLHGGLVGVGSVSL